MDPNVESVSVKPYEEMTPEQKASLLDSLVQRPLHEAGRTVYKPGVQAVYRVYHLNFRQDPRREQAFNLAKKVEGLLHLESQTQLRKALAIIRDHPEILTLDRKIQLQPSADQIPQVVRDLVAFLIQHPDVYSQLSGFKVRTEHFSRPLGDEKSETVEPNVVIYTFPGSRVQELLEAFSQQFSLYPETPENMTPRFNQRIGRIVFFSEGHGYMKLWLNNRGVLGRFYDAGANYAFAREAPDHISAPFLQRLMGSFGRK